MRILITLFITFASFAVSGQNYRLATLKNLPELIENSNTDNNQFVERVAALEFHNLINRYRTENKMDTLGWDETFWLASRNHSLYMAKNPNYFSHNETNGLSYFSGIDPTARLAYVDGNTSTRFYTNENILQNNINTSLTNNIQIAKQMALDAFNQWKESPGHNKNMLSARGFHGVAFVINGTLFYATDLFGKKLANSTNLKDMSLSFEFNQQEPEKLNVVKAGKEVLELIEQKIFAENESIEKSKELTETAKYYVQDRIDGRGSNMERDSFSAINIKEKRKYTQVEMFVFISKEEAQFKIETIAEELYKKLITDNEIVLDDFRSMGMIVKVKRKKGKIESYVILILEKDN
ncbi:MAG: CAP domain-containing protein [Bacteroidetes bacterium]|nr:CAP domain-containing protein [Bacteroidota bacterium]